VLQTLLPAAAAHGGAQDISAGQWKLWIHGVHHHHVAALLLLQMLQDQNRELNAEVGEVRELRDQGGVAADVKEMELGAEGEVNESTSTRPQATLQATDTMAQQCRTLLLPL